MSEEDEISSKRAKGLLDVSGRAAIMREARRRCWIGALRYAGHNPLVRPLEAGRGAPRRRASDARSATRHARAASSCLRISRTGCWACARLR
ncbi:MAG: hypothetical protein ACLR3C_06120 [Eggerthella lenta]